VRLKTIETLAVTLVENEDLIYTFWTEETAAYMIMTERRNVHLLLEYLRE